MKKIAQIICCAASIFALSACGGDRPEEVVPSFQPSAKPYIASSSAVLAEPEYLTYISDYSVLASSIRDAAASPDAEIEEFFGNADDVTGGSESAAADGRTIASDASYIYVLNHYELLIFSAADMDSELLSRTSVGYERSTDGNKNLAYENKHATELYIVGDKLAVVSDYVNYRDYEDGFGEWQRESESRVLVDIYDVSNRQNPILEKTLGQDGSGSASRISGGLLYIVSNYAALSVDDSGYGYVPSVYSGGSQELVPAENIAMMPDAGNGSYAVVSAYDIQSGSIISSQAILGAEHAVFASENSLYLMANRYDYTGVDSTSGMMTGSAVICRLTLKDGLVEPGMAAALNGRIIGDYIDEFGGKLGIVARGEEYDCKLTLDDAGKPTGMDKTLELAEDRIYILDAESMQLLGGAAGIGEGKLSRVKFEGNWACFVSDILVTADLSQTESPRVIKQMAADNLPARLIEWSEDRLFGLEDAGGAEELRLIMFHASDMSNISALDTMETGETAGETLRDPSTILVDREKIIIGFPTGSVYNIYGWTEWDGFFLRARIDTGAWSANARAAYVGNSAYVVCDGIVTVIDVTGFLVSTRIEF